MIYLAAITVAVLCVAVYMVWVEHRIQQLQATSVIDVVCQCEDYGNCGCQCDSESRDTGLESYYPPLTVAECEVLLNDAQRRAQCKVS